MITHRHGSLSPILSLLVVGLWSGAPSGHGQPTSASAPAGEQAFACQTGMVLVVSQGKASVSSGEFVTTKNTPARSKTSTRVQWNEAGLRVFFDCADAAVVATNRPRDDQNLWRDDCVEIFLDPGHAHNESGRWVHIILNAAGTVLDERGPMREYYTTGDPYGGTLSYTATGLVTKLNRQPPGWQAEITLPWESLGGRPAPGAIWGFNLARADQPAEEFSCYSPTYGPFYNIDQWGHLGFATAADASKDWLAAIALDHAKIARARAEQAALAAGFNGRQATSDQTWLEIDGKVYGAQPDERGPIGGGTGYAAVVTGGQYRVSTLDQLLGALRQAQSGETVFVEGAAEIDCSERVCAEQLVIEIPGGVILAGNRGAGDSPGALIYSDEFKTYPLFRVLGPNARVTGLRIRGPDLKPRREFHDRAHVGEAAKGSAYYYKFPTADGIVTEHAGLEVDNCELSGWSHAAIYLKAGERQHIHHNYIHHNQRDGLGYGVALGYAPTEALIERNLFNFNRHSIAGAGVPGNGYEACHNVELGESLSHCFDMHGGNDRGDGTEIAGTWLKIHHNTFRSLSKPISIRGVPEQEAAIYQNWFLLCRPPLTPRDEMSYHGAIAVRTMGNTRIYDNAYSAVRVW